MSFNNLQLLTNVCFIVFMISSVWSNYQLQKRFKIQDKAIFDLYRIVGDYLRKDIDE